MAAEQGSLLQSILPLLVLFAIFYFLIIRPQQKQQKEHKKMIEEIKKGDKLVTNGGLIVEVVKVEDNFLKVMLDDNNFAKIDKNFIAKKWGNESN